MQTGRESDAPHDVRCPYCGRVSGEVVNSAPELLIVSGRYDGRPCRHLTFLLVGLEAFTHDGRRDDRRTRFWLWVAADGLRELSGNPADGLMGYVHRFSCRILVEGGTLTTHPASGRPTRTR